MRIENPLTAQELRRGNLLEPGIYSFEVLEASDEVSKKGVEMIKLKVTVWDVNGKPRQLFDYLHPAADWKIGHFAQCAGIFDKYQEGVISASDCEGKGGECKVYIKEDKTGQYNDQNGIADYVVPKEGEQKKQAVKGEDFIDDGLDDLPF